MMFSRELKGVSFPANCARNRPAPFIVVAIYQILGLGGQNVFAGAEAIKCRRFKKLLRTSARVFDRRNGGSGQKLTGAGDVFEIGDDLGSKKVKKRRGFFADQINL